MAVLAQIFWKKDTDIGLHPSSMHQYGLALRPACPDCAVEMRTEFGSCILGIRWGHVVIHSRRQFGVKAFMTAVRPIARNGLFQARTPTEESIETQSLSVTFERTRSCLGRKSA